MNAGVPPETIKFTLLVPPLQAILNPLNVVVAITALNDDKGCVTVADLVIDVAHPFASLIVTLYVPAIKPTAVDVVCAGIVFHK